MKKNLGWTAKEYATVAGFTSDWRDLWWHQDYLELLAKRWKLRERETLLDVGCGAGHWGQRLATLMQAPDVVGIDHEPGFLDAARARAKSRPGTFAYQEGSVLALPFEDNRFDVVTCQTVMIHVADARAALREMIRVTKPGGIVICAEPNNLTNSLVNQVGLPEADFAETLRILAFDHACVRGKRALGQGDAQVGERLGALFLEEGLTDLTISTNDRCAWLVPPYATAAEQSHIEFVRKYAELDVARFGDKEKTRTLYEAGEGADEFDEVWSLILKRQRQLIVDVDAGRYIWGGGFVMYAASGTKPST
ncbi:MAG: class I SAM-dependent methyltransferase [Myxococcota bacterium]